MAYATLFPGILAFLVVLLKGLHDEVTLTLTLTVEVLL